VRVSQGLRERYETHHKLRYTDEALMAAAKYSSQYISDRFLPDKAIDLIDEAGSRVRLRHIQLPEEARELDKELKQVRLQWDVVELRLGDGCAPSFRHTCHVAPP
jgi:ATP-dependent Clp protease ATP-binding subunit ClpC